MKAQKINQFDKNKKRTGIWKKYYSNKRIRYVGRFLNTFQEYPPRQKAASFSLDQVMEKLQSGYDGQ